jgi:hypothetical protein
MVEDSVPVPDPTTLTTVALTREIDGLRSEIMGEIEALRELLNERYSTQTKALDAAFVSADRAITRAEENTERQFVTLKDSINRVERATTGYLGREEYAAQHEALRQGIEQDRIALAEHKNWDSIEFGKINGAIGGLKARVAGMLAGFTAIVSIVAVLITILELSR